MSNELTALSTLAVEIDALNEQANIFANQAVIYAAKSGQKLLLAKAQCNHGQFKSWLDDNCKLPYSTASKYMRLATARPELITSNMPLTALLPSVTQMMELMNADEKVNEVVTAKIENGEDVTIKEIQRLKKEASDLLAEKEVVQNDLLTVKKSAENYQTMYSESSRQRDELRDDLEHKVESKVNERISETRALLILENQQALADAKRIADNAKDELSTLKKDQAKAIKDGVSRELFSMKSEIDQKRYELERYEKDVDALKKTKSELDVEVGALAIHKESIKEIKENLSFIAAHFDEAFYTACIPIEVMSEWESINYAFSKMKKQITGFLTENRVEAVAIEGELV